MKKHARNLEGAQAPHSFATTHWSMVLAAGRNDTTGAREALENLCRNYWHPLYHYVRRRGYSPADAQDLTQSFFARLLAREDLGKADPQRGRFRSFLLSALKNFLADEWDKSMAEKRGAGKVFAFDFGTEESRLAMDLSHEDSPDRAFERRWATSLLQSVYDQLESEFRNQGKGEQFALLSVTLTAPRGTTPYAELAADAGMTEGAVKSAVHRLRRRYREILRASIAETVSGPDEVDDELRYLMRVLAGD